MADDLKNDLSADAWSAADQESATRRSSVTSGAAARARAFPELVPEAGGSPAARLDMIVDIPVQLTVELGRTKIAIRNLLQLAQGSVMELDRLAGEPMDVLVNGCLIAQGELVVVDDKFSNTPLVPTSGDGFVVSWLSHILTSKPCMRFSLTRLSTGRSPARDRLGKRHAAVLGAWGACPIPAAAAGMHPSSAASARVPWVGSAQYCGDAHRDEAIQLWRRPRCSGRAGSSDTNPPDTSAGPPSIRSSCARSRNGGPTSRRTRSRNRCCAFWLGQREHSPRLPAPRRNGGAPGDGETQGSQSLPPVIHDPRLLRMQPQPQSRQLLACPTQRALPRARRVPHWITKSSA